MNLPSRARSSRPRIEWLRADAICFVLLVLVCLGIGLPRYRSGIDFSDEGFLAYGSVRVMQGQVPNRDFVSLQPPLSFYTTAAAFRLWGTSLAALRAFGLALYVGIVALVYMITRGIASPPFGMAAALAAAFFGLPCLKFVPYAVWQGMGFALVSALIYLQATRREGRRAMGMLAGGATAATLLARQDQGVYLVVSILTYTMLLRRVPDCPASRSNLKRVFGGWLAGGAAVLLVWGIFAGLQGALPEMVRQLIVFPLTTYARTSSLPFPWFHAHVPLRENAVIVLLYLVPIVLLVAAVALWRRFRRYGLSFAGAQLAFLLVWSALFYCQVLVRSDAYHLVTTLPPFFILCACGCRSWWKIVDQGNPRTGIRKRFPAAVICLGAIAAGWFVWLTWPAFIPPPAKGQPLLAVERGGVRFEDAKKITDLVRLIRKTVPPDRSILCLPYQPMFYFLCERRNPTRWNYIWPGDQTAAEHEQLIEQAERDPPALVLLVDEASMESYAPKILAYVQGHYRKVMEAGGLSIYAP